MDKKKILIHSNSSKAKTGFGKHMRNLITYLFKTGKYEIVEVANGRHSQDPLITSMPWKCLGSLPLGSKLINEIKSDPQKQRLANYGHYTIDDIIKEEKPDIYLGIEDVWGLDNFFNKVWWNNINSLIWTPVDSLPLLDKHTSAASKTSNVIVQASFAKKAFSDKGFENVHLMPVPLNVDNFYKINQNQKAELRSKFNIDEDAFIIGFVFRNQLRKSVPNLLDGFKKFKSNNPKSKAKLLFHTHWGEGWDIPRLLVEKGIDSADVLTTYFCDKCMQYEIKPFSGQNLNCPYCESEKSQQTSQITRGVSESQLNEIYNLMDVYCHPFTSGGQEIPIQEAKLSELITLVTDYSCGEDYSSVESGGLPLNWSEYREPGTQFIKASTCPIHIAEQLSTVYNMSSKERSKMGKSARSYIIDFCSIESVCSKFENLIDSLDKTEWDFDFSYVKKNDEYPMPDILEDRGWVIDLYKNILKLQDPEREDEKGVAHWEHRLKNDLNRQQVYNHFIAVAKKENEKNIKLPFESLLSKDDNGRRILFVMPGNEIDVFNSTSLLKYIKEKYPDYNIYYATQNEYFEILTGNPYIYKVVTYDSVMEDFQWSEGRGSYNGMFEFVLMPHVNTHIVKNYIHGNKNKIDYDLSHA